MRIREGLPRAKAMDTPYNIFGKGIKGVRKCGPAEFYPDGIYVETIEMRGRSTTSEEIFNEIKKKDFCYVTKRHAFFCSNVHYEHELKTLIKRINQFVKKHL